MKVRSIFLLIIAFITLSLSAQEKVELVQDSFLDKKIKMLQRGQDDDRLYQEFKGWQGSYRFTSAQVRRVCDLFRTDQKRLEFAIDSYADVVDKENFWIVYDAFNKMSSAIRLYDFILITEGAIHEDPGVDDFYDLGYDYPDWERYNGPHTCGAPMQEDLFRSEVKSFGGRGISGGFNSFGTRFSSYCISVRQLMKICLVTQDERQRLSLINDLWTVVYDVDNIDYLAQLFKSAKGKDEFYSFVESVRKHGFDPLPPVVGNCRVSDEELDGFAQTISRQTFENTQKMMAQDIISKGRCFKAVQIARLVKLFTYDNTQVEMAKFAYQYCVDKENYYQVVDVLSFDSSKTSLMEFIKSK